MASIGKVESGAKPGRALVWLRFLLSSSCGENFLPILGSRFHNHFQQPLKCWHRILMVQPDYFRPHLCRSHLVAHSPNASAINSSPVWVGMLISQTPSRLHTFVMWEQESAACANCLALSLNFAR